MSGWIIGTHYYILQTRGNPRSRALLHDTVTMAVFVHVFFECFSYIRETRKYFLYKQLAGAFQLHSCVSRALLCLALKLRIEKSLCLFVVDYELCVVMDVEASAV